MILTLNDRVKAEDDESKKEAAELANILFDTAAVQAGFDLEDATGFAARVHRMLNVGLKLDADAKPEEETDEVDDEKDDEKEGDDEKDDDEKEGDDKEEEKEEKKDEVETDEVDDEKDDEK